MKVKRLLTMLIALLLLTQTVYAGTLRNTSTPPVSQTEESITSDEPAPGDTENENQDSLDDGEVGEEQNPNEESGTSDVEPEDNGVTEPDDETESSDTNAPEDGETNQTETNNTDEGTDSSEQNSAEESGLIEESVDNENIVINAETELFAGEPITITSINFGEGVTTEYYYTFAEYLNGTYDSEESVYLPDTVTGKDSGGTEYEIQVDEWKIELLDDSVTDRKHKNYPGVAYIPQADGFEIEPRLNVIPYRNIIYKQLAPWELVGNLFGVELTNGNGEKVVDGEVYTGEWYDLTLKFAESGTDYFKYNTDGVMTYQMPEGFPLEHNGEPFYWDRTLLDIDNPDYDMNGWLELSDSGLLSIYAGTENGEEIIEWYANTELTVNIRVLFDEYTEIIWNPGYSDEASLTLTVKQAPPEIEISKTFIGAVKPLADDRFWFDVYKSNADGTQGELLSSDYVTVSETEIAFDIAQEVEDVVDIGETAYFLVKEREFPNYIPEVSAYLIGFPSDNKDDWFCYEIKDNELGEKQPYNGGLTFVNAYTSAPFWINISKEVTGEDIPHDWSFDIYITVTEGRRYTNTSSIISNEETFLLCALSSDESVKMINMAEFFDRYGKSRGMSNGDSGVKYYIYESIRRGHPLTEYDPKGSAGYTLEFFDNGQHFYRNGKQDFLVSVRGRPGSSTHNGISLDRDFTFKLVNEYIGKAFGDFEIQKIVTGLNADPQLKFPVTVKFDREQPFATYSLDSGETWQDDVIDSGMDFMLAKDERVMFKDIQEGTVYEVIEDTSGLPEDWALDSVTHTGSGNFGVIGRRDNGKVLVNNVFTEYIPPELGSFAVRKDVTGEGYSPEQAFEILITFTGDITGTKYSLAGAKPMLLEDNTLTVHLKDNQDVIFTDVPLSVTYTVTENNLPQRYGLVDISAKNGEFKDNIFTSNKITEGFNGVTTVENKYSAPPKDNPPPKDPPEDDDPPRDEDPPRDDDPPRKEKPPKEEEPPKEDEPPGEGEPPGEEEPPKDEEPPEDNPPDEPDIPSELDEPEEPVYEEPLDEIPPGMRRILAIDAEGNEVYILVPEDMPLGALNDLLAKQGLRLPEDKQNPVTGARSVYDVPLLWTAVYTAAFVLVLYCPKPARRKNK